MPAADNLLAECDKHAYGFSKKPGIQVVMWNRHGAKAEAYRWYA